MPIRVYAEPIHIYIVADIQKLESLELLIFDRLRNANAIVSITDAQANLVNAKNILYISLNPKLIRMLKSKNIENLIEIVDYDKDYVPGKAITAIYTKPSLIHYFSLIKSIYNNNVEIGYLHSEAGNPSHYKDTIDALNVRIIPELYVPSDRPLRQINKLITFKKADVLLIGNDVDVDQSLRRKMLVNTIQLNSSAIGLFEDDVKNGALASIFFSENNVADQVTTVVEEFINQGSLHNPSHPKYFTIDVNKRLAEARELIIPDDLDRKVYALLESVKHE